MGFVNPRRWTVNHVTLMRLSLFVGVLLLFSHLSRYSDQITSDPSLLPWYIRLKNERLRRSPTFKWKRPPQPNPYTLPGIYLQDKQDLKENKWLPFRADGIDASAPNSLLETLKGGPEAAGSDYGWFANRTIVLLSEQAHHTITACNPLTSY
jgi:hypothetical protein